MIHALRYGVGQIGTDYRHRPAVYHKNSWTVYASLDASRKAYAEQVAAGNYRPIGPSDPLPGYLARLTSVVKVTDERLVKFQVVAGLELRKGALQPAAEEDFRRAMSRAGRFDPLRPALFPAVAGVKMRLCVNSTGPHSHPDGPNSYGEPDTFQMTPLWTLLSRVKRGWILFIIDVKAAYRLVLIAAAERFLFAVSLDGEIAVDLAMPFGASHSGRNFYATVMFPLMALIGHRCAHLLLSYALTFYMDDSTGGAEPAKFAEVFAIVNQCFDDLRIPKALDKTQHGTRVVAHGVIADSVTMMVEATAHRQMSFDVLVEYVLSLDVVPRNLLESLAGTLNWLRNVAHTLHPVFVEIRRVLKLLGGELGAPLPAEARAELTFYRSTRDLWKPAAFFPTDMQLLRVQRRDGSWHSSPRLVDGCANITAITSDAAGGIGQSVNLFGSVVAYRVGLRDEEHINVEEFFAALRAGIYTLILFEHEPRPLHVAVGCDNTSSTAWLNKGISHIPVVQAALRWWFRLLMFTNTQVTYVRVTSSNNWLSDCGSRADRERFAATFRLFESHFGVAPSFSHPLSDSVRSGQFVELFQHDPTTRQPDLVERIRRGDAKEPPRSVFEALAVLRSEREHLLAFQRRHGP